MSDAHLPTAQSRSHVELLLASGIAQEVIASIIGISVPTLRAHYAEELKVGKGKRIAAVAATVFQMALGRPAKFDEAGRLVQSELKPNLGAACFILKTQAGWKETNVVEIADPTAGARERLAEQVDRVLAASARPIEVDPSEEPDRGRLN